MFRLTKTVEIDAAHRLPGYPGPCERLHGHRWKVTFVVQAKDVGEDGMVIDFAKLKSVANQYDHMCFNEMKEWKDKPPTAENIARSMAEQVMEAWDHIDAVQVFVEETPGSEVMYHARRD